MGHWSVYCGISKIAITQHNKVVFLPIKKNKAYHIYMPYIPATLPVFGEWDGYGRLENIEKNDNTLLIENYFQCSIEKFVEHFLENEHITNEVIKDWTYMYIHRDVYDALINMKPVRHLHYDMGNSSLLKYLGFEYIEENKDAIRYKHVWKYDDKIFHSDGKWLNYNNSGIYSYNGTYNALSNIITLPKNKLWVFEKHFYQLWEILDDETVLKDLLWILGIDNIKLTNYILNSKPDIDILKNVGIDTFKTIFLGKDFLESIEYAYMKDFRKHCKLLSDMCVIAVCLHSMSSTFEPFIHYLTPQDGEREHHQLLLKEFAKINKKHIINE